MIDTDQSDYHRYNYVLNFRGKIIRKFNVDTLSNEEITELAEIHNGANT